MIEPVDLALVGFDPEALLGALVDGAVDFVVIGGIAAILRGDIAGTEDTDTTVRRSQANFAALAKVLRTLDAHLLVALNDREVGTVNVPVTAETFASLTSARFLTQHGILDVVLRPDGVPEFEQWAARATPVTLSNGVEVQVASLDDVIASKTAANRPKDQYALARLHALRDAQARGDALPE